ncbi:MAG: SulP family inorganic anion transporter [Acidimicrobiia bacterium]|nr:SulP family inorganic anion transporter [Acidimicrobiia bacterium]
MIQGITERFKSMFRSRSDMKDDAVAGVVLGIESIPDGLAQGLVAGVNPIFGLYGYMYGMVGAALFTSSVYMTVQATGAMSLVVADVPAVHAGDDADRALFTLAILTGVLMIVAGLLKLGFVLRYVSNAVMVGFMTAVGINIVLGQLENFTGYSSDASNRITRTIDTILSPLQIDYATLAIGVLTIVLIVVLERTRLGALGMVLAVAIGSLIVVIFDLEVEQLNDIAEIPRGLPFPAVPLLSAIPDLIIPAISLAFVGLVQGAGISASRPNPDGEYPDASQDFFGQGMGNLLSGLFRGMPVGGSASATALVSEAGMKTSLALFSAGVVMAITLIFFADAVSYIAMPALAALLIVVGYRTVKVDDVVAVWKTGKVQAVAMTVTLILTIIIPLQYAVLVGVALSMILYVVRSSNQVVVRQRIVTDRGQKEIDPPESVGRDEVILLQLYGSIFFASAAAFEELLPNVDDGTDNSVVILRLRRKDDFGGTFMDLLDRYAEELHQANSKLMLMSLEPRAMDQLVVNGTADIVGSENLYPVDEWITREIDTVLDDANAWVEEHRTDPEAGPVEPPADPAKTAGSGDDTDVGEPDDM